MCVVLALFLCNLVYCCTVKVRNVLHDLIKHICKGSGIGIRPYQRAVSLHKYEYLCRLIERRTSLLSSMKILAADDLIIVKLLSHRHTVGTEQRKALHSIA